MLYAIQLDTQLVLSINDMSVRASCYLCFYHEFMQIWAIPIGGSDLIILYWYKFGLSFLLFLTIYNYILFSSNSSYVQMRVLNSKLRGYATKLKLTHFESSSFFSY